MYALCYSVIVVAGEGVSDERGGRGLRGGGGVGAERGG